MSSGLDKMELCIVPKIPTQLKNKKLPSAPPKYPIIVTKPLHFLLFGKPGLPERS